MKKLTLILMATLALFLSGLSTACVSREYKATQTYTETENKTEYRTESYTTTENSVVTKSDEQILTPKSRWSDDRLANGDMTEPSLISGRENGNMFYCGWEIARHDASRTLITFYVPVDCKVNVFNLSEAGQIYKTDEPMVGSGMTHAPYAYGGLMNWNPAFYGWLRNANEKLMSSPNLYSASLLGGYTRILDLETSGVRELAIILNTKNASGKSLEKWVTIKANLTWTDKMTESKTVTKERQVPYQVPVQVEKQKEVTRIEKVPFWELIFKP